MSAKGVPVENAFAESFMGSLKVEEIYMWDYETYTDVLERIPYFIEEAYNRKRLHSSLGYIPPEEFENKFNDDIKNSCKIYFDLRLYCVQILGFIRVSRLGGMFSRRKSCQGNSQKPCSLNGRDKGNRNL